MDQVAVALSGLCLAHCLLLPVAIAALPFLSGFNSDHWHAPMLLFVVPVSVIALALGFRKHGERNVVALGIAGLVVLIAGGTIAHARYGVFADQVLTVAGSLMLAVTHYCNFKLAKIAPCSVRQ